MGSAELLCDRDISCQPVAAFDWSPDKASWVASAGCVVSVGCSRAGRMSSVNGRNAQCS